MIKTTYGALARLRELPGRPGPLSRLGSAVTFDSFASRWLVSKFLKTIVEEIQSYEKALLALGQTYGEILPNQPDSFSIKQENLKVFNTERAKLDEIKVEINVLPLPLSVIEQVSALTPFDLNSLEPFIALPPEPAPLA